MTHQQASEGSNIISNQLWLSPEGTSLEDRNPCESSLLLDRKTDPRTIDELETMGYSIQLGGNTSDLINAIYFDPRQVSPWRGSRNNWEDEGIGWKLYIN